MQILVIFSFLSFLSFSSSIPLMQLNVPNMLSPRLIKSVNPKSITSGLFTDASPIFEFQNAYDIEDTYEFPELESIGLDENSLRYNYLNNYLGYNMLIV